MPLAVALFSGGTDSLLAVRILQREGFDVAALHVRAPFECCHSEAAAGAAALGVPLSVVGVGDDYFDLLRKPAYGYGRGANPCVDCRIYMARTARRFMEDIGASLVVTGEVLGQRPMSQKRRDLARIERDAGLKRRLLRPLSARLLPPTIAEREGLIDRSRLYAISGASRRPQRELAAELGLGALIQPSSGCMLCRESFAPRVFDLLEHDPRAGRWDFELLKVGRHYRYAAEAKVVVGRNAEENLVLRAAAAANDAPQAALLAAHGFSGPEALLVGRADEETLTYAAALVAHHGRCPGDRAVRVRLSRNGETHLLETAPPLQPPPGRL